MSLEEIAEEIRITISVNKAKNAVKVYDFYQTSDHVYVVMELLEGGDMDCYIREQGKAMTIQQIKDIGSQIISGIRYLHDKKIIHQVLKPPNILFSSDYDLVKLVAARSDQKQHGAPNLGLFLLFPRLLPSLRELDRA